MYTGSVEHWCNLTGYGLALYHKHKQVFIHHANVITGNPSYDRFKAFNTGDSITFDIDERNVAYNIKYVSITDIDVELDNNNKPKASWASESESESETMSNVQSKKDQTFESPVRKKRDETVVTPRTEKVKPKNEKKNVTPTKIPVQHVPKDNNIKSNKL